ncbi:uncharacterized protein LOC128208228 isoform X1 [Mya arenaria]|uniref:uncharacterized protein LOC128208228 isoform X1 n=1 Tax=Mya arenaria TaxID=6604 RepID=UPI0022DE9A84|nr:uncharacterized protein LOC128208228 isoform X1 [Mya arenaria]
MSSGVTVADECCEKWEKIKIGHKYSYIIFKIADNLKSIVVDCVGNPGESYDSLVQKLIEAGEKGEGRYAVVDCQYEKTKASKLVFIMWLPDDKLGIKQKMLYSSSKKVIKDKLNGIAKELQCNDTDDLSWSNLVEKCCSKYD